MSAAAPDPRFGVYVHWPYCAAICPYCDFNVYRDRGVDEGALVDAILADIAGWRARAGARPADTVFLGGGTPSRLSAGALGRIVEAIDRAFGLPADAEVSLEANPEDAASDRLEAWRAAGVTRLSLGVQAFDDRALRALGRAHSAAEARAVATAAAARFPQTSLDLIYARAGQTPEAWARELEIALAVGVSHLSLYQLTIEPGTAFARRAARGDDPAAPTEEAAALYEATQAACAAAGYPAYEVSNHAVGPAAQARHNLLYWRSREWAGVGPGAHGRLGGWLGAAGEATRVATTAARRPEAYSAAVAAAGWGVVEAEPLSLEAQREEMILMGLRLAEGLDLTRLAALGGAVDAAALAALEADGLLRVDGARAVVTEGGRLVTDRLALALIEAAPPAVAAQ